MVASDPPRLDAGDLLVDLPGLLADAPSDATLVVFHSAVLAFLDQEQRSRFTDVMGAVNRIRDVRLGVEGGARRYPGRGPESEASWPVHPRPRPGACCRDRTTWPQPRLASTTR
jgi:hypothetical protein